MEKQTFAVIGLRGALVVNVSIQTLADAGQEVLAIDRPVKLGQ